LYSDKSFNNLLQAYDNNPDDQAKGFATCKLCTDGRMTCDAHVYGGKTTLIASHIHKAKDNDGVNGEGPPVVNFCGTNAPGLLNAPGDYHEECEPYNDNSSSVNNNMRGIKSAGVDESIYELVSDIGLYPERYYLNFHSIASWSYWLANGGMPKGMCRGVMVSSSSDSRSTSQLDLAEERG